MSYATETELLLDYLNEQRHPEGENAEWQVDPGESADDVFGLYREEIERAKACRASRKLRFQPGQGQAGGSDLGGPGTT